MAFDFYTKLDRLGSRMKQLNGKTVTITTDAGSVSLTASITRAKREELAPSGGITVGSLRTYIFDTDELVISGSAFLPARGDEIVEAITNVGTVTCHVLSDDDSPPYEFVTPTRKRIQVFTKIVSIS